MKDTQFIIDQDGQIPLSRTISFFGEMDDVLVQQAILTIQTINEEDKLDRQEFLKQYPKATPQPVEPIILDIQSPGGSVRDGFSLIAVIEQSEAPVHTRVNGYAFSMAFLLFLAGKERIISRHAEVMYHQLSSGTEGCLKDIEDDIIVSKRLLKKMEEYTIERCKVTKQDLHNIYRTKHDKYYTPQECLALNIATKIV